MNNLSVYKSNDLIDASYQLSTQAQKLILACLAKIDSRSEICKEMSISANEFSELMGIPLKNAHRDLYKAADSLFDAEITLRIDGNVSRLRWVQESVEIHQGEGAITLIWSDKVVAYISQLQSRFTGYKLKNISLLQSSHSIRIYELLMRFKSTGDRSIELDDFKLALGIVDKYALYKDLNKWVIKPALKELNERSDLTVSFETIKKGRRVTGFVFSFKQESQQKIDV
tara:strand:+ start:92 stop:775 length:684 start_codon:yes stop_codon:yes gene_type:complete